MDKVLIGVVTVILAGIITGGFSLVIRSLKKIFRKIELIDIKQHAIVYAMQRYTGNGFTKDFDEFINKAIKDDNFINQ